MCEKGTKTKIEKMHFFCSGCRLINIKDRKRIEIGSLTRHELDWLNWRIWVSRKLVFKVIISSEIC